jgi:hypothetical protein
VLLSRLVAMRFAMERTIVMLTCIRNGLSVVDSHWFDVLTLCFVIDIIPCGGIHFQFRPTSRERRSFAGNDPLHGTPLDVMTASRR